MLGDAVYEEHVLDQGDQYKGMLVGDVKHGLGAYIFTNGDMYEGEFQNDDMCGYGSYTFSSDGRYEGQVCILEPTASAADLHCSCCCRGPHDTGGHECGNDFHNVYLTSCTNKPSSQSVHQLCVRSSSIELKHHGHIALPSYRGTWNWRQGQNDIVLGDAPCVEACDLLWDSGTMLCTRALAWKPLPGGPHTTAPTLMEHATAGAFAATTMEITTKANGEQGCATAMACRNAQTTRPM